MPSPTLQQVRSTFEVADAALLQARTLQQRQDWKFVVPESSLPRLFDAMAASHAALTSTPASTPTAAGASTTPALWGRYASTYFDTPDLRTFHDHRRGRTRRFKVRVRRYLDRGLTFVEVKHKHPRHGTTKHRLLCTDAQAALDSGLGAARDPALAPFLHDHVPVSAGRLLPALQSAYTRVTLLNRSAPERVTVDLELAFARPARRAGLAAGLPVRLDRVAIIEVKSASPRHATPTLQLLRAAGFRPTSLSKYCVGVTLTHPSPPATWFSRELRHLARATGWAPTPPPPLARRSPWTR